MAERSARVFECRVLLLPSSKAMNELAEIRVVLEDGFADVNLPVVSFKRDLNGIQQIWASGQHDGRRLGFQIEVGATWERQDLENNAIDALYWGRANLISTGTQSDLFLRLLDELYCTALSPPKMRERTPFLAVSLEGNPSDLHHTPVKLKLFFESDDEERDADFFINIDIPGGLVEFREKDMDYRRGVVLSLSTETPPTRN